MLYIKDFKNCQQLFINIDVKQLVNLKFIHCITNNSSTVYNEIFSLLLLFSDSFKRNFQNLMFNNIIVNTALWLFLKINFNNSVIGVSHSCKG